MKEKLTTVTFLSANSTDRQTSLCEKRKSLFGNVYHNENETTVKDVNHGQSLGPMLLLLFHCVCVFERVERRRQYIYSASVNGLQTRTIFARQSMSFHTLSSIIVVQTLS